MSGTRALTSTISTQIADQSIKGTFTLTINSIDYSEYLSDWTVSFDKNFGSASGIFTLNNNSEIFSSGGSNELKVGYVVELVEQFTGDATEFTKFYGLIDQRIINESGTIGRNIVLTCLDYISVLKNLDLDLKVEGTKIEVTDEILTPNYLSAPNENLSQIFDFANDSIAEDPRPLLMIRNTSTSLDAPQYDGFEIAYSNGQVRLGSPLNTRHNFQLRASSYSYYIKGKYAEDVLESIITAVDGYGGYLFGESSAQDVIDNHLTDTINSVTGSSTDTMSPNYTATTVVIETTLNETIGAGNTSVALVDATGFPTSGSGTINGDTFTWAGKSGNTLTGIPATGGNSLNIHSSGDYVEYSESYAAGRVWYLSFTNLVTVLTSGDFTIGGGGTFSYSDKRFGRIILTSAISTSSTVTCDTNYSFKTLQATGIEINKITFRSRELDNRFEAVQKLRKYLAPNYIIMTRGDSKIWSRYLRQKVSSDYDLTLAESLEYLEDEDLYTRVIMYGKNKNPTNIMYSEDVSFSSTGETYKGSAVQNTLTYDSTEGNYYVYKSVISAHGYIDSHVTPYVYINGTPINNSIYQLVSQDVTIEITARTETKSGCHGVSSDNYNKEHTYYYYKVRFPFQSLEHTEPIYLYDSTGVLQVTISPDDKNMDYGRGIWTAPGDQRNSVMETISTATFSIFYSTNNLIIDYDNVYFKIDKAIIGSSPLLAIVQATYDYWSVMIPVQDIASVIDGRWDSQVQIEFFSEPPSDYPLCILDLGSLQTIQAIDIVSGYFKPDEYRKFDIEQSISIEYSTDNVTYALISDETSNIELTGGSSVSFEEEQLGKDFQARYLKMKLKRVKKIDYRNGEWVAAFSEISAYNNIVIKATSSLISTTTLNGALSGGEGTITVVSTSGFASTGTAYLNPNGTAGNIDDAFTYTGITATTFTGCSGAQVQSDGVYVSQSLETDTTLYDYDGILPNQGDRVYKDLRIDDATLFTTSELETLSKNYLEEFVKNHTKVKTKIMYAPYLEVGQTLNVNSTYNNITNVKYFIESVKDNSGGYTLVLARYPS